MSLLSRLSSILGLGKKQPKLKQPKLLMAERPGQHHGITAALDNPPADVVIRTRIPEIKRELSVSTTAGSYKTVTAVAAQTPVLADAPAIPPQVTPFEQADDDSVTFSLNVLPEIARTSDELVTVSLSVSGKNVHAPAEQAGSSVIPSIASPAAAAHTADKETGATDQADDDLVTFSLNVLPEAEHTSDELVTVSLSVSGKNAHTPTEQTEPTETHTGEPVAVAIPVAPLSPAKQPESTATPAGEPVKVTTPAAPLPLAKQLEPTATPAGEPVKVTTPAAPLPLVKQPEPTATPAGEPAKVTTPVAPLPLVKQPEPTATPAGEPAKVTTPVASAESPTFAQYRPMLEALSKQHQDSRATKILIELLKHIDALPEKDKQDKLLAAALKTTYDFLISPSENRKAFEDAAQTVQGHPSTGLMVLGGLMVALGIAVFVLGLVFLPYVIAAVGTVVGMAAAASVTGAAIGFSIGGSVVGGVGVGFFGASQRGVSGDMSLLGMEMGRSDAPHYSAATATP